MPRTTIEDAEDGDMSEYGGDLSSTDGWSADTNNPHDGTHSVRGHSSGPEIEARSQVGNGLGAYPAPGDLWEGWVYLENSDRNVKYIFAENNQSNRYYLYFDYPNNNLTFRKEVSGTESDIASTNASLGTGNWYRWRIHWASDNSFEFWLYDDTGTQQANFTASDSQYTAQDGQGFWFNTGPTQSVYFDTLERIDAPNAPSNVSTAVDSTTQHTISWDDVADEDNYRLEVSEDGGAFTLVATPSADTTSYQRSGVSESVDTFQYRVRAENIAGESSYTTETQFSTNPSGLSVTAHDADSIDLSWNDVDKEDGYKIWRAESTGTTTVDYTQIDTVAAGTTTYTDTDGGTNLEDGEQYFYRVTATYGTSDSPETGEVSQVTDLPAPSGLTLDTSTEDEIGLSWTKNDDSPDGEWEVFRSTDGTLGTKVADALGAATTSHTDTGLADGEQYHYTVRRLTDHAQQDTSQVNGTTVLPAPTGVGATVTGGDQLDVSWTDNADNEDGYRVYTRPTGGAGWTQDGGDLAANTVSHTTVALLDGEQYDVRVEVFTEHTTTDTILSPAATTTLPDVGAPTLDASTEDQIGVSWTDVTDYGDYRVQLRQTSDASWFDQETVVGQATTSTTFTGLGDGEEYEVRMRTETEHVTGSWTTAVSATTILPAPSGLSSPSQTTTSIDLSWTDNADNEDGFKIRRREKRGGSFDPWQEIDDIASDSTSYTDSTAVAGTTYEYLVRAYTEHSTADSGTVEATASSLGKPSGKSATTNWYVKITAGNGSIHEPVILDTPQINPTVNGLPRIEIPVPRNEKWQSDTFEQASVEVWYNGEQAPIEELNSVSMRPDRTVLEGWGGVDLLERVTASYVAEEAHTAIDTLASGVGLATNIDTPANAVQTNQTVQSADTDAEFDQETTIADTEPFASRNGNLEMLQMGFTVEAEDADTRSGADFFSASRFSGDGPDAGDGMALRYDASGESATWNFTPEYTIPAGDVAVYLRIELDNTPELEATLEVTGGATLDTWVIADNDGSTTGPQWQDMASNPLSGSSPGYQGGDLQGGTQYTVTIESTTSGGSTPAAYVDVVAPLDGRGTFTFDNTPTNGSSGNRILDGPEHYPTAGSSFAFDNVPQTLSVSGGRIESSWNDTSNGQAVAISNDGGETYPLSASNTTTHEADFGSLGPEIRWQATLAGFGTQDATPQTGVNPQHVQSFTLKADLDDTPLLIERNFDDRLLTVARTVAEEKGFVFEIRQTSSGLSFEMTQPGQRTSSENADVIDYEITKQTEDVVEKATIYGSATRERAEDFTADHGTFVSLEHDDIVENSEVVYDQSTDEQFVRGTDYEIDWTGGRIKALASGSMSDSTTYQIDYRHQTQGSYDSGAANPREIVEDIPGLTTDRACELAARQIVDGSEPAKNPIWEADMVVPKQPVGWNVIDEIDPSNIPNQNEGLQIRDIQETPEKLVLRLASRRTVGQRIASIRSQVQAVSRKT